MSGGRPRTRARATLAAATIVSNGSGRVRVGDVAAELAVPARSVRYGLAELKAAGLARYLGGGEWIVSSAVALARNETPEETGTKPTDRTTRARLGGLQRALQEVTQQRDEARAKLREKGDGDAVVGAVVADLRHAAGCDDAACKRCIAIRRRLAAKHPSYLPGLEVADRLERGSLAARAGAVLVGSPSGAVGGVARVSVARRALALAIAGDVVAADRALDEIGA